jgi:hypothetical protein
VECRPQSFSSDDEDNEEESSNESEGDEAVAVSSNTANKKNINLHHPLLFGPFQLIAAAPAPVHSATKTNMSMLVVHKQEQSMSMEPACSDGPSPFQFTLPHKIWMIPPPTTTRKRKRSNQFNAIDTTQHRLTEYVHVLYCPSAYYYSTGVLTTVSTCSIE